MNRSSDYINFDTALRKGNELLKRDRNPIIGFYILLSINLGLRVSDVLRLKHSDLSGKAENHRRALSIGISVLVPRFLAMSVPLAISRYAVARLVEYFSQNASIVKAPSGVAVSSIVSSSIAALHALWR